MGIESELIYLALTAFVSSMIAGVFGFGGGMLLIAALPNFLPAAAIIPVHSAVQLISNSSRALLSLSDVHWVFVAQYSLGAIPGIFLTYWLLQNLSLSLLPAIIGLYILLNVWSKTFQQIVGKLESFYAMGAVHTGISLLVGAPGPLPMPLLMRRLDSHHQMVCTLAVFVALGHLMKIAVFVHLGFVFSAFLLPMIVMGTMAIGGSIVGTHLRNHLAVTSYVWIVKILLSSFAMLAIYKVLPQFL